MKSDKESEAAVLVLFEQHENGPDKLLLTKRASFLRSHPGEISFPGGMREAVDVNLQATALRESEEEVGLDASMVDVLGSLPERRSRNGVSVSPFVARLKQRHCLQPNLDELECLFWAPVSLFTEDKRSKTHIFTDAGGWQSWSPVYQYGEHMVWGLTAKVIVDFVSWRYGIVLPRAHPEAPESHYK